MTPPANSPGSSDSLAPDALAELASLYVLGSLEANEARRFEERLDRGDSAALAALEMAQRTVAELDLDSVTPRDPSPGLRDRILASTKNDDTDTQVWKSWTSGHASSLPGGLATMQAADGDWEITGVDGVSVKRLFVDNERKTITMLVRMAAGASYPPHRHAGPEECLVLDGDLHVAGQVLRAGAYQRAEAESIHGVQSTTNGCTLFITSSQEDELLVTA